MKNYAIIGSSAAGIAAAKTILERDAEGKVTMVTLDKGYYSRCQLHLSAVGKRSDGQIYLDMTSLQAHPNFEMFCETKVVKLEADKKKLILNNGQIIDYDKVLIASGSSTFFPPIPGLQGKNTFGLRNLEDAHAVHSLLPRIDAIAIIGAGLVGVELAVELARAGKKVSLIELADHPLPLQLEDICGQKCAELLSEIGVDLYMGEMASEVIRNKDGSPRSVKLKSGTSVAADIVVCAAGVRPNVDFAAGTDLNINRGVLINCQCRTNLSDVFAAGDVAETNDTLMSRDMPSAIWPVAVRHGKVAGSQMTGGSDEITRNTGMKAAVNVPGAHVISIGPVTAPDEQWRKLTYYRTDSNGKERLRIVYLDQDNILRAALLWGDVRNAGLYHEAIINKRPLSDELPSIDSLNAALRGFEELSVI